MEPAQTSSGMIFRQIHQQNIPHNTHPKNSQKKSLRKTSQLSNISKNPTDKENLPVEHKQLQVTGQSFFHNIQRQSTLIVNYDKTHELNEKDQSNQITLVKVSLNENKRPKGIENLKHLFQNEAYVKRLIQRLPVNSNNVSTIHRQHKMFSTSITMETSKGDQILKFSKKSSCLSDQFEIISQNMRQNILGRMRSNFFGSRFDIYERVEQSSEERLVCTIYYDDKFSFSKIARSVQVYLVRGQSMQTLYDHETYQKDSLKILYEQGDPRIIKLHNKQPEINEKQQYVMNFGIKGVIPSVKNTILIDSKTEKQTIKFYKINDDDFQIKVSQNMSVFLGYCFALSSLVFKLACQ